MGNEEAGKGIEREKRERREKGGAFRGCAAPHTASCLALYAVVTFAPAGRFHV